MQRRKSGKIFLILLLILGACSPIVEKTATEKQELSQVVAIGSELGNVPPSFTVIDTENNTISLQDYIDAKKPVLVYFFATWCPHCSKDFSYLSKVYANYSDVDIIAIGMDLEETGNIIANYKSRYPQLREIHFAEGDESIIVGYNVKTTTTKYAIKDGKIIYAGSGVFNEKNWGILLGALSK